MADGTVDSDYSQTVQATGGTGVRTWSATGLPAGLAMGSVSGAISGKPTAPGSFTVTVQVQDSGAPPQTASRQFSLRINPAPLKVTTASLLDGVVGQPYSQTVQATGGTGARTWSATGLPSPLVINPGTGEITGTPAAAGTFNVTVQVQDSASPPQITSQAFSLHVVAPGLAAGQNDTVATATPLVTDGNRRIVASTSPFRDQDFYRLTASAGAVVKVEIFARRLTPESKLDPVLLIVRDNGTDHGIPFDTCKDPGNDAANLPSGLPLTPDPTPNAFDDVCINDDIRLGIERDSRLEFQVPGSGTVEFFVRVLDFRGDGRPDFRYELEILGAQ